MDDPKLIVALQNSPGNFLTRLSLLEQHQQDLQVYSLPPAEVINSGRTTVFDLALFPIAGVIVTEPTNIGYTGGFINGNGIVFGGSTYVLGNVVAGVIKTGFTNTGTLYAIDANIAGTVIIGSGSTAGGWFINSTQIFNGSISLDSSIPAIKIGAATAIMTGTGIFMGLAAGAYQMRIGDPAANYLLWNGTTLSVSGQWIKSAGMNPALQEWETNIVFSSASDTQVNWTSGTIRLSDGTTYSIVSGNTSTMAALTYIYLDIAVSVTVLQKTTTYSTATGDGKILIAAAQNATAGASVICFSGQQPIINGGAQITALSILAGNIAAGAITATKISVTSLSAITATMGALTIDSTLTMSGASGAITIGTTPPSSATVGTGLWIDRTGVYALASNVQQTTLTSAGLSAGAGTVTLNSSGIQITANEFSAVIAPVKWIADTGGEVGSVLAFYVTSSLVSGAYLLGKAKSVSHSAFAGIATMASATALGSYITSFKIDTLGVAALDLRAGTNTATGSKALDIQVEYSTANARQTVLYLDTYTTGTPASGLGTAISLRAENSTGVMQTIGFISARYTTVTNGAEVSEFVFERMVAGVVTAQYFVAANSTGNIISSDGNTVSGFKKQTQADDTATTWDGSTFGANRYFGSVVANGDEWAFFFCPYNATITIIAQSGAFTAVAGGGTLAGTTGTDGKINLRMSNNVLYVENRIGGARNTTINITGAST